MLVITDIKGKTNVKSLEDAVCFAVLRLLPKRRKNLFIDIDLCLLDKWGYCNEIDDNNYLIEIRKTLTFDSVLSTLFHEMVHVKQMIHKEEINEDEAYELGDKLFKEFKNVQP
jgi:hypothetical protein